MGLWTDKRKAAREEVQREADMASKGYQKNEQGQWAPTEYLQQSQDLESEKMKQELAAIKAQNKALQEGQNSETMMNVTEGLMNNNFKDVQLAFKNNKWLKDHLANSNLDITDMQPINFDNPDDLTDIYTMYPNLKKEAIGEQELRNTIASTLYKVRGKDGKWRTESTDDLIKQTNQWNDMTQARKTRYTNRARQVNSTIKGATISQGIKEDTSKLEYDEKVKWLEANPDKSLNDYVKQSNSSNRRPTSQEENIRVFKEGYSGDIDSKEGKKDLKEFKSNLALSGIAGKSEVRQQGDIDVLTKNKEAGSKLYGDAYDDKEANRLQTENENVSKSTVLKPKQDTVKNMKGRWTAINAINSIQNDATVNQENLAPEVKRGIIDSSVNWSKNVLGIQDAQNIVTNMFNTKAGYMIAQLMKDMSGLTVSEAERETYQKIILSGDWSSEEAAMQSLSDFKATMIEYNDNEAATVRDILPKDAHTYSNYTQYDDVAEEEPASKQIVYKGKTYNVDANGNMEEVN